MARVQGRVLEMLGRTLQQRVSERIAVFDMVGTLFSLDLPGRD